MSHLDLKNCLRLAVLALLVGGCAADPDEYNGSCTLSCSNPRAGSAQYTLEPMVASDPPIPIPCFTQTNPGEAANGPIRVQYRIYESRSRFGYPDSHLPTTGGGGGGEGGDTGGGFALQETGGESGGPLSEPILSPVMKGGIGFEPIVYGAMAVDKTNEEHKDGANSATPFKFAGIVTPSSEWCSDSCGVMTYEFWPTCINDSNNPIQAGVAVHGAKATIYTKFSLVDDG